MCGSRQFLWRSSCHCYSPQSSTLPCMLQPSSQSCLCCTATPLMLTEAMLVWCPLFATCNLILLWGHMRCSMTVHDYTHTHTNIQFNFPGLLPRPCMKKGLVLWHEFLVSWFGMSADKSNCRQHAQSLCSGSTIETSTFFLVGDALESSNRCWLLKGRASLWVVHSRMSFLDPLVTFLACSLLTFVTFIEHTSYNKNFVSTSLHIPSEYEIFNYVGLTTANDTFLRELQYRIIWIHHRYSI